MTRNDDVSRHREQERLDTADTERITFIVIFGLVIAKCDMDWIFSQPTVSKIIGALPDIAWMAHECSCRAYLREKLERLAACDVYQSEMAVDRKLEVRAEFEREAATYMLSSQ